MQNVINICGLNGAGKSTLGRALAEELGCRFLDIEDLYFSKDNPGGRDAADRRKCKIACRTVKGRVSVRVTT